MKKQLHFGISTTVLREHPVSYALERIARAGYASAEVWPWHVERTGETAADLAALSRKLKLGLSVHAFSGELNPVARDGDQARKARGQIAAALELADELGARVVVVHPARRDSTSDRADRVWTRMLEWLVQLDELADPFGLSIGLELMERDALQVFTLPGDAARLMKTPFKRIGLTVDVAHLSTHGDAAQLLGQIEPSWITHIHLSDSVPWQIHLPLGEGRLALGPILEAIPAGYRGLVSLEGSVPGRGETVLRQNMAYLKKLGYG
jgi:sugar phosphate isomerase/epimerase